MSHGYRQSFWFIRSVATFRRSNRTSQQHPKGIFVRFRSDAESDYQASDAVYLHVGPSGDCWSGHSIFAAKHLQPDYVKSLKLKPGVCVDTLLEILEENEGWTKKIYDDGKLPESLMEYMEEREPKQIS